MIQTEKKHMQARIITDRQQWNDFVADFRMLQYHTIL